MGDRLKGKVAIVTGAGGGIGGACALAFAEQGAAVIGCDIDAGPAEELRADAGKRGVPIDVQAPVDLFDASQLRQFIDGVAGRHGAIDVLVNAAARSHMAWIEDMTPEQFRDTMIGEVDLVFRTCKAAWPHLRRRGGSIINFSSVNAWMAVEGLPSIGHAAGKAAVLGMTRQLAMEGAPHRIRANTVAPGLIVTGKTEASLAKRPEFRATLDRKIMLKRLGRPEDVAHSCVYLASDEAEWVTGTDLRVDGGMMAW